jgi:hypothetical protein
LKVLCALSYVIDFFKDETVKAVTEEQKKAIFSVLSSRDTFVCLQLNYGKSLNYQVAPAKTGLISRGEYHSLSWQFLHMRDRKRVRSGQRSLLLRFPAQIETSASRELACMPISFTCMPISLASEIVWW